ncbi:glycoside hydrolase family 25 protein [Acinetobacter sp. WZC-1]|uniref:glycoside hydrolase family 25 protein n=1 Tax=Acinetobacter sp. WZC-1 TaxID=3459034 RepID=UPI00403DB8DB
MTFCRRMILAGLICLLHSAASAQSYPIRGFDVSHHQGRIDWQQISPQQYQFVYLKATEGGDYRDDQFQDYWLQAREQGLRTGAYHYFNLCGKGETQARNFMETVPNKPNALPPVIDLEYDNQCINTRTREQLLRQIQIMHDHLYRHYGKQPIFYTSRSFYHIVLIGQFSQTPIWIREYQGQPELKDHRRWTFWQHTSQGHIPGIARPVDLNVFHGSEPQWQDFLKENHLPVSHHEEPAH